MATLHALHPESRLSINEQDDVFHNFSAFHLARYIDRHGIEIQSKRTLRNGTEARYTAKRLSEIWEMHLRRLLIDQSIHLPQLIKNYHDPRTNPHQKRAMYFTLKNIGMHGLTMEDEIEREALMIGIAMLLSDNLDIETSLLHTFEYGNDVGTILDNNGKDRKEMAA